MTILQKYFIKYKVKEFNYHDYNNTFFNKLNQDIKLKISLILNR